MLELCCRLGSVTSTLYLENSNTETGFVKDFNALRIRREFYVFANLMFIKRCLQVGSCRGKFIVVI